MPEGSRMSLGEPTRALDSRKLPGPKWPVKVSGDARFAESPAEPSMKPETSRGQKWPLGVSGTMLGSAGLSGNERSSPETPTGHFGPGRFRESRALVLPSGILRPKGFEAPKTKL